MWWWADVLLSKRVMRGIFCWLSCFLLLAGQMFAAEPLDWAFIGVWDRSMPQVEAACRENGIHAEFFKGRNSMRHRRRSWRRGFGWCLC